MWHHDHSSAPIDKPMQKVPYKKHSGVEGQFLSICQQSCSMQKTNLLAEGHCFDVPI